MREHPTISQFPPQLSQEQLLAIKALARTMANVGIQVLDALGRDPDLEVDDPLEANGDELDRAWVEWDRMRGPSKRGPNFTLGDDDCENDDPAEDDDPAGGAIDDEPHDWNELELDEGECGHTRRYGVDQTRSIGPENPEAA